MTRALARVALLRIARGRRGWLPIVAWTALAIGVATIARATGGGAGRVLLGPFNHVILPLAVYGIVSATVAGGGIRSSARGLVAIGASPRDAAVAMIAVATATSAVVAGLLGALACLVAHGSVDPPLASDLPATFGVAFVGGAAYAAFFCAASAIGRGAMRSVFLVADWMLGLPAGFGAIFVPRGHVTSLLGGPPCFDLSRRASSVLLVALLAASLAVAARLGRRPG